MFRAGLATLLLLSACGQSSSDGESQKARRSLQNQAPLHLTALELTAHTSLRKRIKDSQETEALEAKVNKAMQDYLIDPFSARYSKLRSGRSGAVCGQVNAKNRLGAYVGSKDFVLGKDGKTIYMSQRSDGIQVELYSSFAEAYLSACASKGEANLHEALTHPGEPVDLEMPAEYAAPAEETEDELLDPFAN
jgi:hypothetical protein